MMEMKESSAGVWELPRAVRALTSLGLAILMWQGCPGRSLNAAEPNPALKEIIEGPQRSAANVARPLSASFGSFDIFRGVWTLPPTYRLGTQDREKYAAIGESDRFVLKFVKPAEAK
jgi:hypothetical protein